MGGGLVLFGQLHSLAGWLLGTSNGSGSDGLERARLALFGLSHKRELVGYDAQVMHASLLRKSLSVPIVM